MNFRILVNLRLLLRKLKIINLCYKYIQYLINNGKKYADERRKLYYKRHNANSSKYSADNLAKLILW